MSSARAAALDSSAVASSELDESAQLLALRSEAHDEDNHEATTALFGNVSWRLILAAAVTSLGPTHFGASLAYSSPAERSLRCDAPDAQAEMCKLNGAQFAVFASINSLGCAVGTVLAAPLSSKLGRAAALRVASIPGVLGWATLAMASHVWSLYAARFFLGMFTGVVAAVSPAYLVEIAPLRIRGFIGASCQIGITVGILLFYILGMRKFNLSWRALARCGLALDLVFLVLSPLFMPESPSWLAKVKRDHTAAAESLRRLGRERESICSSMGDDNEDNDRCDDHAEPACTNPLALLRPPLLYPLRIAAAFALFQQLSGINAVVSFTDRIFVDAGVKNADQGVVLVGVLQVLATIAACFSIEKFGRRALLTTMPMMQAIASILLAVAFYLPSAHTLAVLACCLYIIAFNCGVGPLPWLLNAELFPEYARAMSGSFLSLIGWLCSYTVIASFEALTSWIGTSGTFVAYGAVCACASLFAFIFLPETRGRSSAEILDILTVTNS